MTYQVLKFALWILLSLPILVLGIYFFVRLLDETIAAKKTKRKNERIKAEQEERKIRFIK